MKAESSLLSLNLVQRADHVGHGKINEDDMNLVDDDEAITGSEGDGLHDHDARVCTR